MVGDKTKLSLLKLGQSGIYEGFPKIGENGHSSCTFYLFS